MILKIFAIRILGALITFGLGIYLARMFGVHEYGLYIFVLGSVNFIVTLGQLGTGMGLVKLRLGNTLSHQDKNNASLYIWHVVISMVGICVLLVILFIISKHIQQINPLIVIAVTFSLLGAIFSRNIYQSVKRSDLSTLPEMLIIPSGLGLTIALFAIQKADNALVAYALSAGISSLIFIYLFFCYFKEIKLSGTLVIKWWDWLVFSLGFFVAQIGHALLFIQLPIAFGFVASLHDMGIFSVAYRLAATQLIIFAAIGIYVTPHFADHRLVSNPARLTNFLRKVIGICILSALPMFLVLFVFPSEIIVFLYGDIYKDSSDALSILAIGIFIHAASGPMGIFLLMNGETRYYNIVSLVAGILGIVLMILTGHFLGIIGAAWCLSLTIVVWKILIVLRSFQLYKNILKK